MGVNSQIYIRYAGSEGVNVVARHYCFCFGARLVSKAKGVVAWLKSYAGECAWVFGSRAGTARLSRICDADFDEGDVAVGADIIAALQREDGGGDMLDARRGSGQVYIDITDDGIKYAFVTYSVGAGRPVDALEYMELDRGRDWRDKCVAAGERAAVEYTQANAVYLSDNAALMTPLEVARFVKGDYSRVFKDADGSIA